MTIKLTTLPADIGQLTSLMDLHLTDNQLTSVPSEIGQLTSLTQLGLHGNQLTSRAGGDRAAHVAGGVVPRLQSADERAVGDWAAHLAGEVVRSTPIS